MEFAQVTRANKAKLTELGYSDVAIATMKPAVALGVIDGRITPNMYAKWAVEFESKQTADAEAARQEALKSAASSSGVVPVGCTDAGQHGNKPVDAIGGIVAVEGPDAEEKK